MAAPVTLPVGICPRDCGEGPGLAQRRISIWRRIPIALCNFFTSGPPASGRTFRPGGGTLAPMDRSRKDERQRDWDIVSRWMLPGIVLLLLLTGIDTLAYHLRERDRRVQALEGSLPRNYEQTIRALVVSFGHSCDTLCGLTPLGTLSDKMTIIASCGVASASGSCERKASFTLTITPSTLPSR